MFVGVDIGSTTTEAAVLDYEGNLLGWTMVKTSHDRNAAAQEAYQKALDQVGIADEDVLYVGATGYGRRAFERADMVEPEIVCHAVGTERLYPGARTIIDIGGQDCKVIECYKGRVMKFEMNDKCAAGTGRFFEVLSHTLLETDISDLGPMALKAEKPARISSMCTVFAETEIVSLLSQQVPPEEIALGILEAVARRIISLAGQAGIAFDTPTVLSGGVAKNEAAPGVFKRLLRKEVVALDEPQLPAALGIAIMTRNEYLKNNA